MDKPIHLLIERIVFGVERSYNTAVLKKNERAPIILYPIHCAALW